MTKPGYHYITDPGYRYLIVAINDVLNDAIEKAEFRKTDKRKIHYAIEYAKNELSKERDCVTNTELEKKWYDFFRHALSYDLDVLSWEKFKFLIKMIKPSFKDELISDDE